jgi:hypothetical protein
MESRTASHRGRRAEEGSSGIMQIVIIVMESVEQAAAEAA